MRTSGADEATAMDVQFCCRLADVCVKDGPTMPVGFELSKIQMPSLSEAAKKRRIVAPLEVDRAIDDHTMSVCTLVKRGKDPKLPQATAALEPEACWKAETVFP